jgi:hypothetical protein
VLLGREEDHLVINEVLEGAPEVLVTDSSS